jgi:hypothetical protein
MTMLAAAQILKFVDGFVVTGLVSAILVALVRN